MWTRWGLRVSVRLDDDHLCTPIGVAVDDDGNVYVADGGNNRLQKFNAQGEYLMTIGEGWGRSFGQFNWAEDVDIDAEAGSTWRIGPTTASRSLPEGAFLTSIGGSVRHELQPVPGRGERGSR